MLSNLVRFPIVFISGVFAPVADLPEWGQFISRFSPVTYVTDLMAIAFGQNHFFSLTTNYVFLLFFTLLFIWMAVYFHKKTMTKRI